MKFNADKRTIINALTRTAACLDGRAIVPILNNVLFEANAELRSVMLSGTNIAQRAMVTFDATRVERGGKTTIPAKQLLSLLKNFSGDDVTFETDENHHTAVKCGTTEAVLLGLPETDFPDAPEIQPETMFSINGKLLADMLNTGGYACSRDDARKVMQGVLFDIDGEQLTIVSSDGKRLAKSAASISCNGNTNKKFIVPGFAINSLKDLPGDVELLFSEKLLFVNSGNFGYSVKLIDGSFPNYRTVIPQTHDYKMDVNANVFLAKVKTISVLTTDSPIVALHINGNKVDFINEVADKGKVLDSMEVADCGVDNVKLFFNPVFLADAFTHTDSENVRFCFNKQPGFPAVFESENSLSVIMPINRK